MKTEMEPDERPRERSEKPQEWRAPPRNLLRRAATRWKPIVATGADEAATRSRVDDDVSGNKESSR